MPAQRCARPAVRLRQIGKNFPSVHSMETEETPIYVQGEKEKCQYYVCSSSAVPAAAVRARAHAPRGAAAIRAIPVIAATAGTVRRSVRRAAATAPAAARGSAAVRGSAAIPPTITGSMRSAPAAATTDKKDGASRLFYVLISVFSSPRRGCACLFPENTVQYRVGARGATGRRAGLRIRWETLQVQILSCAPRAKQPKFLFPERAFGLFCRIGALRSSEYEKGG